MPTCCRSTVSASEQSRGSCSSCGYEPTQQGVQALAERTAAQIERALGKAGRYLDEQDAPELGFRSPRPCRLILTQSAPSYRTLLFFPAPHPRRKRPISSLDLLGATRKSWPDCQAYAAARRDAL
jgi:hypothetical protein